MNGSTDPSPRRSFLGRLVAVAMVPELMAQRRNDPPQEPGRSLFQSARAFGAKGDGRSDDTSALQAGIDALAATGGGTLFLPAGVYLTGGTVALRSRVHLLGDGVGATILRMARSLATGVLQGTDLSDIGIAGMSLFGTNRVLTGEATERLVYLAGCQRVMLTDLELAESTIAVQLSTCTDWVLSGSFIHDILSHADGSEGYGVLAPLSCARFTIRDIEARRIGRHAVYVTSGSSDFFVEGVHVDTVGGTGIIVAANADQPWCESFRITGCSVHNVARATPSDPNGIGVSRRVRRFVLSHNQVSGTASHCYALQGDAQNAAQVPEHGIVMGNQAWDPGPGAMGLLLLNCSHVMVVANDLEGGEAGIRVATSSTGAVASVGNVVEGNSLHAPGHNGIWVTGPRQQGLTLGRNAVSGVPAGSEYRFEGTDFPDLLAAERHPTPSASVVSSTTVGGDYTARPTDSLIRVDCGRGPVAITLPAASGLIGLALTIKKVDPSSSPVRIRTVAADHMDGLAERILSRPFDVLRILSSGSGWDLV